MPDENPPEVPGEEEAEIEDDVAAVSRTILGLLDAVGGLRIVRWAGRARLSKVLSVALAYGVPGLPAFLLGFFVSPLAGVSLAFGLFVLLSICREFYWQLQRRSMKAVRDRVQRLVLTKSNFADTLRKLAERVHQPWHATCLHASYWIDEDRSQGRFQRRTEIVMDQKADFLLTVLGEMRIGARGDGTKPAPLDALGLKVTASDPDIFVLLLPVDPDQEDPTTSSYWHFVRPFVYAAGRPITSFTITVEANWPELWAPLFDGGEDAGELVVATDREEPVKKLVIDVFAPQDAASGQYEMLSDQALKGKQGPAAEYDSGEKRFRMRLEVDEAPTGNYKWRIKNTKWSKKHQNKPGNRNLQHRKKGKK